MSSKINKNKNIRLGLYLQMENGDQSLQTDTGIAPNKENTAGDTRSIERDKSSEISPSGPVGKQPFSSTTNRIHTTRVKQSGRYVETIHYRKKNDDELKRPAVDVMAEDKPLINKTEKVSFSDSRLPFRTRNPADKTEPQKRELPAEPRPSISACPQPSISSKDRKSPSETIQTRQWASRNTKICLAALTLVLIYASITFGILWQGSKVKEQYNNLLAEVSVTENLNQRYELLKAYANSDHPKALVQKASDRMESIRQQILFNEYVQVNQRARELSENGQLEEALAAYEAYERQHPANKLKYKRSIAARKKELSERIETRDFKKTTDQGQMLPTDERLAAYRAYLTKYPNGMHREMILSRIAEMADEYYINIERRILESKASSNWQQCIDLCQQYIDNYSETSHAMVLKKHQDLCREELDTDYSVALTAIPVF